jgi:hypothetical protein
LSDGRVGWRRPFLSLAEIEKEVHDGPSAFTYRKYLSGTFAPVVRTRALLKSGVEMFEGMAKSVLNRPRIRLFRMSIFN